MALRAHNKVNSHISNKLTRSESLSKQIRRYPTLDCKLDSVLLYLFHFRYLWNILYLFQELKN